MNWRQTCAMDERRSFILQVQRGEGSISELCAVYGVSRKTGYKWLERYRDGGEAGLQERSRAPLQHPNAIDEVLIEQLLGLRRRYPSWGPRKLLDALRLDDEQRALPAISTAAAILKRHGLVKPRRRRRHTVPYGAPYTIARAPNDLWAIDFKGQFRTGNRRYCYPLTVSDAASRYLLGCQGLDKPTYEATHQHLECVFGEHGLPGAIRSDNGTPFASSGRIPISRLSLWWIKLGIVPERIQLAHPEQNGRHERMHRTLKQSCSIEADLARQQRALDRFRREYNEQRPHQALGGKTPAMVHVHSRRELPTRVPALHYPAEFEVRRIKASGELCWRGEHVYLSGVLAGELVGLSAIDDGLWQIHVGAVAVARIDANARIEPIDTFVVVPVLQ